MRLPRRPSKEPLWKDEFSIFTANERYVSRRQFTKFLVLTSLGMFVGNLWILAKSWFYRKPSYQPVTVGRLSELPVGSAKQFFYPGPESPCILVRPDEDTVVAFSQKCTHLACPVYYARQKNRLECPCHEGYFSVKTGEVLQGPPPRPLPKVLLERKGDELVAVAMETHEKQ